MIAIVLYVVALIADEGPIDFTREVAPILEKHCVRCHRDGEAKGEVRLDRPDDLLDGGYAVAGHPDDSELIPLVVPEAAGGRPRMPKSGAPLDPSQVETLRRWIIAGAAWPDGLILKDRSRADRAWWSLQPIAKHDPPSPTVPTDAWRSNPIDAFILDRLAMHGLQPSPPADRRTLIRRLSYDLTGLPPTPESIADFEQDDDPLAYEKRVDRLLASPAYGERWARHWLDVVRFGESRGFERNEIIPNAWPFRDYVVRSFNEDKPFDRLILEHLAGDVVGKDDPAVEVGTTFLVAGPYDDVGNQDAAQAAQIRANTIDDVIVAAGSAFLGLTIGCARCHDHKFDPIPQSDYYRWYATFAGVKHGSREVAAPADRQARDQRTAPLAARRDVLAKQRSDLVDQVVQRGESSAAAHEAAWTRPPAALTGVEDSFPAVEARWVRLTVDGTDGDPTARAGYQIEELEAWTNEEPPRNVALASNGATAEGASRVAEDFDDAYGPNLTIDGRFGAAWLATGFTLTIKLARPEPIHRITFSSNREGNFHKAFPAEYRLEVSTDGSNWTEVASGRDRKPVSDRHRRQRLIDATITTEERTQLAALDADLQSIAAELAAIPSLPNWWVGTFEQQSVPTRLFTGGDPQKPAEEVSPSSLQTLADVAPSYALPADAPESARREALARWIVDPANPLTARVLANRVWLGHFGAGIVDTPSDFGFNGSPPSHPELLDWLALKLQADGWRLKPLHRLIVTSQTYQQSSRWRADAVALDADNRALWRFQPRRLSAEELRDTMLDVAGVREGRMGGPGFRLYRYLQDNVSTYVPLDDPGPDTYRRAIYHQNARAAPVDLFAEFDCPDNAVPAPRRDETTTPLQALTLLNHAFTLDMADAFARRLQREAGDDPAAQVDLAFQIAYGRAPADAERAEAEVVARDHGLATLTRAILNSSALLYVD